MNGENNSYKNIILIGQTFNSAAREKELSPDLIGLVWVGFMIYKPL